MLRLSSLVIAAVLATGLSACSSSKEDTNDNVRVGDIRTNDVWKNGFKLTGVVRIFEGATVEIEPGARITCEESVMIQVGGTVRVRGSGNHAIITCSKWTGFQVVTNGVLDVEGLDIENADIGVQTTKGAGSVSLTDSQILTSTRPFLVGKESTLTLIKVKATTPTTLGPLDMSVAEVFGSLIAKRLEYQANTYEGIMVKDGGEADIEDSTLKAVRGLDLVSAYGAKSIKLRYSTLTGAHCGPHIQGVGSFEIDHISSEDNIYGITIYAASPEGPHTIKDSNFSGAAAWLDLTGDHGPLNFQNVFTAGNELVVKTDPPIVTRAPARIENAGPRPE